MIEDGVFDYIVEEESGKVVEKTNDALQKRDYFIPKVFGIRNDRKGIF